MLARSLGRLGAAASEYLAARGTVGLSAHFGPLRGPVAGLRVLRAVAEPSAGEAPKSSANSSAAKRERAPRKQPAAAGWGDVTAAAPTSKPSVTPRVKAAAAPEEGAIRYASS